MTFTRPAAFACLALFLSSCAPLPSAPDVSRGALAQGFDVSQERILSDQAIALTDMTQDIRRHATTKGAALGALAGCGVRLATGSTPSDCVTGVVAGGALGAMAGAAKGERDIDTRLQAGSLSRLKPAVVATEAHMAQFAPDLQQVLAAQEAEITALRSKLDQGEITRDAYEARLADIAAHRRALAEALSLSAAQLAEARIALEQSASPDGAAWYVLKTQALEQQVVSARAQIDLLW